MTTNLINFIIDTKILLGGSSENEVLPKSNFDDINIDIKHLKIKNSNIKEAGLGVFTDKKLKINDIVEIAPVLKVQTNYLFQPNNVLNDYIFRDTNNDEYKLVALGYGSMYNHSDTPNLKYYCENDKMIYQATRDIDLDEELYISYGPSWWKSRTSKLKV